MLVVEDAPGFARLISSSLGRQGFQVRVVANGADAVDAAADFHPDAVVLDLDLRHDGGGIAVLDELRVRSAVPIVVVSRSSAAGSVRRSLDRGADDYVTKPFSPAELGARVRAVIRRQHRPRLRRLRIGERIVDLDARTIEPVDASRASRSREARSLGRGGWRLLETLLGNEGRILYRDELLEEAFGPIFRGDGGYLQEQIRRLRRGLGIPAWSEGPIRTIHGVGYAFDGNGEIPPARARRPRSSARMAARPPADREATPR